MTKNVKKNQQRVKVRLHHSDAINTSIKRKMEKPRHSKVHLLVDGEIQLVEPLIISPELDWRDFEVEALKAAGATDLLNKQVRLSVDKLSAVDNVDNIAATISDETIYKQKED